MIEEHNSRNHSWTMGENNFTDLTHKEFSKKRFRPGFLHKNRTLHSIKNCTHKKKLPYEFDWVKQGAVTKIKNQGQCGSCWTFSSTGAVEGAWFIKTGKLVSLSEQELVDCCNSQNGFSGNGCNGGEMDDAFNYVAKDGLCSENDYEYTAKDGTCQRNKCESRVTISSYEDVTPNSEQSLQSAVYQQPVSVAIEADHTSFQFYSSGVYNSTDCGDQLDHGVLVVGWGILDGSDYWKIKNSWGENWGNDGYIYIARNIDDPRGQCGVAMQPSYPIV